jgi:hypothetical protein
VAYVKARAPIAQSVAAGSTPNSPQVSQSAPAPVGTDGSDELAVLAASGQKIVIYCILLTFLVRALLQGKAVAPLVAMLMAFGLAGYSLVGVLRICSALKKSQNEKLMFMALSCVPGINLVALLVLNVKATALLRSAGWRVGLLGARP